MRRGRPDETRPGTLISLRALVGERSLDNLTDGGQRRGILQGGLSGGIGYTWGLHQLYDLSKLLNLLNFGFQWENRGKL